MRPASSRMNVLGIHTVQGPREAQQGLAFHLADRNPGPHPGSCISRAADPGSIDLRDQGQNPVVPVARRLATGRPPGVGLQQAGGGFPARDGIEQNLAVRPARGQPQHADRPGIRARSRGRRRPRRRRPGAGTVGRGGRRPRGPSLARPARRRGGQPRSSKPGSRQPAASSRLDRQRRRCRSGSAGRPRRLPAPASSPAGFSGHRGRACSGRGWRRRSDPSRRAAVTSSDRRRPGRRMPTSLPLTQAVKRSSAATRSRARRIGRPSGSVERPAEVAGPDGGVLRSASPSGNQIQRPRRRARRRRGRPRRPIRGAARTSSRGTAPGTACRRRPAPSRAGSSPRPRRCCRSCRRCGEGPCGWPAAVALPDAVGAVGVAGGAVDHAEPEHRAGPLGRQDRPSSSS